MITEDYVSFDVAKLLKEKGFDVYGDGSFDSETEIHREYSPSGKIKSLCGSKPHKSGYPAPTLQMVMKWLREVHKLSVEVNRTLFGYIGSIVAIPSGKFIEFIANEGGDDLSGDQYTTWEEAVEAALKYSLENLI